MTEEAEPGRSRLELKGSELEREKMMDPTVKAVLEQGFAERSELIRQTAMRGNSSSTFIQEQSELGFLNESRLVGALAAGRLEKNALADSILQQRAAAGQPGNAPAG